MTEQMRYCSLECPDKTFKDIFLCSSCKGPFRNNIYYSKDGANKCESCRNSMESQSKLLKRNYGFEKLLKFAKITCLHNGCEQRIPYYEIDDHQNYCIFKVINCDLSNCTWEGKLKDRNDHYLKNHCREMLHNPVRKLIDLDKRDEITVHVIDKESVFAINIAVNMASISYQVFQYDINLMPRLYTITFFDKNNWEILQLNNLTSLGSKNLSHLKVDLTDIKVKLGLNKTLKCIIDVTSQFTPIKLVKEKILKNFQCSTCEIFIEPPIFLDKTFQNICLNCKASCSQKTNKHPNRRNFVLEALNQDLKYPMLP